LSGVQKNPYGQAAILSGFFTKHVEALDPADSELSEPAELYGTLEILLNPLCFFCGASQLA
jgi:hypothetical protein